ncbi:zinc finger BED domain-containing protein 5-like [Eleginops maclovinus]
MDGERTYPPLKKRRISEQRFKLEYNAEWPTITRSKLDDFHAYCMLCKTDFSVRHGGRHDVEKHIRTAKHTSYKAAVEATRPIAGFFTVDSDTSVINAEVLAVDFLVEHNIPIAVADHIGPLVKKMFPDSKIAGKYGSGRTKSSAIVGALAKEDASVITEAMRTAPYSLATDGSTDYGDCKLYPLVVKYFDRGLGRVLTVLLSLPECHEASTGQNIFKLIDNELEKRSISWDNCMSFGADNAMVMQGLKAGTAGYINKKNSAVYVLGCPCHLIHLAAEKAAAQLPVSIEELLVDIYFYLDKSSKRKQGLKKFQDLCGVEMRKIVKHVSTRWLSLDKCIARLLQQWPALLQYFESEKSGHSSKDKTTQSSS